MRGWIRGANEAKTRRVDSVQRDRRAVRLVPDDAEDMAHVLIDLARILRHIGAMHLRNANERAVPDGREPP